MSAQNTHTTTPLTGEQIYDAIMRQIEPDLVTTSGVRVDAPEDGENSEHFSTRMKRYKNAFALYEKCFESYVAQLREESKKTRLAARHAAEQKVHDEEEAKAEKLLSDMTRT